MDRQEGRRMTDRRISFHAYSKSCFHVYSEMNALTSDGSVGCDDDDEMIRDGEIHTVVVVPIPTSTAAFP